MARTISTFGQLLVTIILALVHKQSEIQLLQHEELKLDGTKCDGTVL